MKEKDDKQQIAIPIPKEKEPQNPPRPATMIPEKYCPRCSPDTYIKDRGVNGRYKIRCEKCGGIWDWKHLTGYVFVEERPMPPNAPVEEKSFQNWVYWDDVYDLSVNNSRQAFIKSISELYIIKRKA